MYPPSGTPALSGYPNQPPPCPSGYPPPPNTNYHKPPPQGPYPPPPSTNYHKPPPQGPYPPPPNTNYPNPPPQGPYPPSVGQQAAVVDGIPVGGTPLNHPQPPGVQTPQAQQPAGYWSTGLCDCFSDLPSCFLACLCPCVAFGRLSEIVDKGSSSCGCNGALYGILCSLGGVGVAFGVPVTCQSIYSCSYRGKLKQDMNMPPNCCEDCCVHFWCEPCAIAQEYRELQNRGYDLALGWNGNMEKQRHQPGNGMPAMRAAPAAPSMAR